MDFPSGRWGVEISEKSKFFRNTGGLEGVEDIIHYFFEVSFFKILFRWLDRTLLSTEERREEEVFISAVKLNSCQAEFKQKAFEPLFIPTRVSLPALQQ